MAPRAIVLCPTRELAQQVAADAINFVHGLRGMRVAIVVGGVPFVKQVVELQNASIVVATPGRLLDLQDQGKLRLDAVQHLVVDEADRMLDLGFAEDLDLISNLCKQRDQTMMFSATFAPRIMQLAANLMRNPGRLELAFAGDKHADITQTLHWADSFQHKKMLLGHWLRDEESDQILVFASTQVDTEALADELIDEGYDAAALHGAMPQHVRNKRLQSLRDGRIKILVATDVAARGIDVPTISHVINFGLPMKAEDYVHRIGRTGRAGRSGKAITLAEFRERHKIRAIEQFTQQQLSAAVIPGLEPAQRTAPPMGGRREFGAGRSGGYAGGRSDQRSPGRYGVSNDSRSDSRNDRGHENSRGGAHFAAPTRDYAPAPQQEHVATAEVREFKPAVRKDWKPGGFAEKRQGGFEGRSQGYAGKSAGAGYAGKPSGGYAGKPSGGFAGKPSGPFAGKSAGGAASHYAGKPASGFAARSAGFAGKPSGGFAAKAGYAGQPSGVFNSKPTEGFGAGRSASQAPSKPVGLSKPAYSKVRRAA